MSGADIKPVVVEMAQAQAADQAPEPQRQIPGHWVAMPRRVLVLWLLEMLGVGAVLSGAATWWWMR